MVSAIAPSPLSVIKGSDSVTLFIDGANTDGACRDAGFSLNFAKAKK